MELLLRTGLRIGELADLDVGDVRLTQRTGELVIGHGKGDRRRVVPLNRAARAALRPWLTERVHHPTAPARDRGRCGSRAPARSSRSARSPRSSRA
jgi:site-specific recombinase XerC